MLDFMRRNAASWGIKILLGFIALSFALFFGYSAYQGQSLSPQTAVIVEDTAVSLQRFNQIYDRSLQGLRQNKDQEVPEDLARFLRSNVLEQIVQRAVWQLFAESIDFRVADLEVARMIRRQEQFKRDGVFNYEFYNDQFRPYYRRQYGQDYEEALREDLLLDSFRSFLDTAYLVSPEEEKWQRQRVQEKEKESDLTAEWARNRSQWVNLWLDDFRKKLSIQKNPGL